MTTHKLRIIVEKVDSKTDEVVARNIILSFNITKPKNIIGLGLRHTEQINLLQSIQDYLLGPVGRFGYLRQSEVLIYNLAI